MLEGFPLLGLRTHCPEIWYMDILNILAEGVQGNGRTEATLTFWSETGYETLRKEVSSLHPEERSVLISKDKGMPRRIPTNRICYVSPVDCTSAPSCILFLHECLLFLKPSTEIPWSNYFSSSSFLKNAAMSQKVYNKYICMLFSMLFSY